MFKVIRVLLILGLLYIPSNLKAQIGTQSPSIRENVTFQWSDFQDVDGIPGISDTEIKRAATIQSITINGEVFNTFAVPSRYQLTRLGPGGNNLNAIIINTNNDVINAADPNDPQTEILVNGPYSDKFIDNSSTATLNTLDRNDWDDTALTAFRSPNLNIYFESNANGDNICGNFDAANGVNGVQETDAQIQTLFYEPAIPSNEGGVIAVTERGGNNCYYIRFRGFLPGSTTETVLGDTFVRANNDLRGENVIPPDDGNGGPNDGDESDYWQSGRKNANSGQAIAIALFNLNSVAPTGSFISKVEFIAATNDDGDGKFFILQRYAQPQVGLGCIDDGIFNGQIDNSTSVPVGSTYELISAPSVGSLNFNSDGSYTYTPPANFTGDVSFTYRVRLPAPNNNITDTNTVTLTYDPLPENPNVQFDCSNGDSNITLNVTSPLGNDLEYSIDNRPFQSSPQFTGFTPGTYPIVVRNTISGCTNPTQTQVSLACLEICDNGLDDDGDGLIDCEDSDCNPFVNFFSNGSMESYSQCPNFSDEGTMEYANNWNTSLPPPQLGGQLMVNDPSNNCISNRPGATWEDSTALSGGSEGIAWLGMHTEATFEGEHEDVQNTLANEMPPGTYTIRFKAGYLTNENDPWQNPGKFNLYGIAPGEPDFIRTRFLDQSDLIDNEITNTNEDWQEYTFTFTSSETIDRLFLVAFGTGSYLIFDQFEVGIIPTLEGGGCLVNGGLDLTASQDPAAVSYNWYRDGVFVENTTSNIYTAQAAGVYTVEMVSDIGCFSAQSNSVEVFQPEVTSVVADVLCINDNSGFIDITVTGGTEPYIYNWSNGATTEDISDLPEGNYSVTITDANGCEVSEAFTIDQPNAALTANAIAASEISCFGLTDGAITISFAGGTSPYDISGDFTATDVTTDQSHTGLAAGTYNYTITDANGCTETASATIAAAPSQVIVNTTVATDISCNGITDGTVTVTATGGTSPLTYDLLVATTSGGTTSNATATDGDTDGSYTGLPAGFYTVLITDNNNCGPITSAEVEVVEPDAISISITSQTNIECTGLGSIIVQAVGGTGTYIYSIDGGNTTQNDGSFDNLTQGNYTITVVDINNCTEDLDIFIENACIALVKVADVTLDPQDNCLDIALNGTINYIFTVSNQGNVSLDNVVLDDPLVTNATLDAASDDNADGILSVGESWTYNGSYDVDQDDLDAGQVTNTATVTADDPADNEVDDTSGATITDDNPTVTPICFSAGINIVKIGVFNNENENECSELGETITYTITVTNTGNVSLENVIVTDSLLDNANPAVPLQFDTSGDVDNDNELDPNEIWVYIGEYPITEDDIIALEVDNTAIVNAQNVVDGNSVTNMVEITTDLVEDTTPPDTSSCDVLDETIECNGANNETLANQWNTANIQALLNCATDNCDDDFTVTSNYDYDNLATTCGAAGTIDVVYTLTDAQNNSSTYNATFTIEDTTAPVIDMLPSESTIDCPDTPNFATATATDACGSDFTLTFEDVTTDGNCAGNYSVTRTWTATDECGNSSTATQIINVQDITAPVLTVPANVTVECSDDSSTAATGTATATDNCATTIDITFNDVTTPGSCAGNFTITRTWTATDECGNDVSADQVITVQDTTAPEVTTPAGDLDVTIECSDTTALDNAINSVPTATDNCSSNIEITLVSDETVQDTNCANASVRTRTWTFDDGCGNVSDTFTQVITVIDTTAPVLITTGFDENINVSCDAIPEIPELMFEDNCSTNVNLVINEDINFFPNTDDYEIIREWTVDDGCGNIEIFTQTISVSTPTISSVDGDRCWDDGTINLFDFLPGDVDTSGTWSIVIGNQITIDGNLFTPQEQDTGNIYTFRYTIDGVCETTADVNITINDDCIVLPCGADDVNISKTVTANGDFVNEFFRVTGVETCGFVTEVQIFNRWGAVIYKNNNYQNDWSGQTTRSSVGNSGNVPTGTYYYVVTLRNSGLEPFAGPIYVVTGN